MSESLTSLLQSPESYCLVIDSGSFTTRFGLNRPVPSPLLDIESTDIFDVKSTVSVLTGNFGPNSPPVGSVFFGEEALSRRSEFGHQLRSRQIVKETEFSDSDMDRRCIRQLWDYCTSQVVSSVGSDAVDFEETPLVITVSPATPRSSDRLGWIPQSIFEMRGKNARALALPNTAVCALLASGRTSGLVVDFGHDDTLVTPISHGFLSSQSWRYGAGGNHVTTVMARFMAEIDGIEMTTLFEKILVNDAMKPMLAFVAATRKDYDHDVANPKPEFFELPDGSPVAVTTPRVMGPEIYFQPRLLEGYSSASPSIPELMVSAIEGCDEKIRTILSSNIVVTGGGSRLPGLKNRLASELGEHGFPDLDLMTTSEKHLSWIGASLIPDISCLSSVWITREEYQEAGVGIIERKKLALASVDAQMACESLGIQRGEKSIE